MLVWQKPVPNGFRRNITKIIRIFIVFGVAFPCRSCYNADVGGRDPAGKPAAAPEKSDCISMARVMRQFNTYKICKMCIMCTG